MGYDETETILIKELKKSKCSIKHSKDIIENLEYDLIVCFGYKHIIDKDVLEKCKCPIINLHIAYLPFNRGSDPNFWSFFDNTPSGVTIHQIDEGIDTGPILYQRQLNFDIKKMTFHETYKELIKEIENLFLENINDIINLNWKTKQQNDTGTFHRDSDLPLNFNGWGSNIFKEIKRLKSKKDN